MADIINARILLRGDSEANWLAENPALAEREPSAIIGGANHGRIKIGDGVTPWSDLPFSGGDDYADEISGIISQLASHTGNRNNPHGVTAAQVGAQPALSRTVVGDDSSAIPVFDTGGDLSIPVPVTIANPSANNTQTSAGTRTLRSQLQTLVNNIASLFNRIGSVEGLVRSRTPAAWFLPVLFAPDGGGQIVITNSDFNEVDTGWERRDGDFVISTHTDSLGELAVITGSGGGITIATAAGRVAPDVSGIMSSVNTRAPNMGSVTAGSGTATDTPAQTNTAVWGMLQNIWNRLFAITQAFLNRAGGSMTGNLQLRQTGDPSLTNLFEPAASGIFQPRPPVNTTATRRSFAAWIDGAGNRWAIGVHQGNNTAVDHLISWRPLSADGTTTRHAVIGVNDTGFITALRLANNVIAQSQVNGRFVPAGGSAGQFLRQDMAWADPPGGGFPRPPATWYTDVEFPRDTGVITTVAESEWDAVDPALARRAGDFVISMHSASRGIVASLQSAGRPGGDNVTVIGSISPSTTPGLDVDPPPGYDPNFHLLLWFYLGTGSHALCLIDIHASGPGWNFAIVEEANTAIPDLRYSDSADFLDIISFGIAPVNSVMRERLISSNFNGDGFFSFGVTALHRGGQVRTEWSARLHFSSGAAVLNASLSQQQNVSNHSLGVSMPRSYMQIN